MGKKNPFIARAGCQRGDNCKTCGVNPTKCERKRSKLIKGVTR